MNQNFIKHKTAAKKPSLRLASTPQSLKKSTEKSMSLLRQTKEDEKHFYSFYEDPAALMKFADENFFRFFRRL